MRRGRLDWDLVFGVSEPGNEAVAELGTDDARAVVTGTVFAVGIAVKAESFLPLKDQIAQARAEGL